ncbi:BNR-4 repeat-containing protein [Flammeovirga sp. OC4]|uniref:BNR-4 repeat-containing protein n=1 Tax=Flammeovirga sp. OC4 TaxID=1382345 RepID=UPI0009E4386F|nr:BNR-4 repeat-containing protein [Flammeovirga sp. OC4]
MKIYANLNVLAKRITSNSLLWVICVCYFPTMVLGQVTLESETKISDIGLHFDGQKVGGSASNTGTDYDYFFGPKISAHGDCITEFDGFVFMTWYKGGKNNRQVMLSRYNKSTGVVKTIEFPHRHTGYQNKWWIGESHNTIAVGVSPLNGTIHLLYDMHAYSRTKPSDGSLSNDYFRYSYSVANAATVSDSQFKLSLFVNSPSGNYKHLSLNGGEDYANFSGLTYPKFFLNDQGDLFVYIREGGNNNGAYKFSKYNASNSTWSSFTSFNVLNAKGQGEPYNWGLYGNMKYVNGKIRIGFQRRSSNNNDKFQYQNGFYYAYSDNQNGTSNWKNYKGQGFSLPLLDADKIKISEPGDLVATTQKNKVYIVSGFDWTVTENGDVHFVGKVKDNEFNVTKNVHTYKKAGNSNFTTTTNFSGAERIYTSGDDIYIIGLNSSGRVFIEKGTGGTNNFTRVYEATSGKRFRHGQVYVKDGKVYYYMMERQSGDAQPLYLQIIDLGIPTNTPPVVNMTSPTNNITVAPGSVISLGANASDNGSIDKVNFRVNNAFYKQDRTAPYSVSWTPTTAGTYTIDAVAYDEDGLSTISSSITVNVQSINVSIESVTAQQVPNVAANLLDGDVSDNSRWSAQGFSKTVVIDLGSIQNITGTKMWTYLDRAYQYRIRVSNSPTSGFNTVVDRTGNTSTTQPLNDNFNASGRYVKLIVEGAHNYTGDWVSINEFEVLTSGSSSARQRDTSFIEEEVSAVTVFPNPSNGTFTIDLKGIENADILIYNMKGQLVHQEQNTSQSLRLSKGLTFNSGVYLIRVIDQDGNYYDKKLMIR